MGLSFGLRLINWLLCLEVTGKNGRNENGKITKLVVCWFSIFIFITDDVLFRSSEKGILLLYLYYIIMLIEAVVHIGASAFPYLSNARSICLNIIRKDDDDDSNVRNGFFHVSGK